MSFKDGEMHTLAVIGACVLSAGLGGGLYGFSGEAKAESTAPALEDLEAIEASIATRKKPAKLPQKQFQEPPPEQEADKVSRTADKMTDPPKDKPNEPKIDPNDPLKNVKRREVDDDKPVGKPTEDVGDFNENERGFADETKGHPFFQRVARDINDGWEFPKILSATKAAVGCLHITADGKIAKTKLDKSGDAELDQSAEDTLKKVETKRNNNPEPVPTDIAKLATTRWICFKFNPQSRTE
jgi:outer membrane biosynthesis protein TonB